MHFQSCELDQHLPAYQGDSAYDLDNRLILRDYPKRIINVTPKGGDLLELGLGHGETTRLFSMYYSKHVVIDASPAIIKEFQNSNPDLKNVEIVETYFEDFDTNEKFDVICMGFILEHVKDPAPILQKFKAFLKPGGMVVVTVPNGESLHRRIAHAAGLLPDMMALGAGDHALGHLRTFSVQTLTNLLNEQGYHISQMEGLFLKPLMTSQLLSLDLTPDIFQGMMEVGRSYPELCNALLAVATLDKE